MIKKSVSLTAEGKKELEAELEKLIKNRPEITKKIATAREFGDLSENEEYSSARNEQKLAEMRIQEIEEILRSAKIIRGGKKESAVLGATVSLDLGGKKVTYTLVGPTEADPLAGKISDESPIGKIIFNKKVGHEGELPNGKKVKILAIE